jgi:hypothetical protein
MVFAGFAGVMMGMFLYDADIAWFEQGFTFGALIVAIIWGFFHMSTFRLHHLYWQNNPGIGLVRLTFWVALTWCAFTLVFFGDSSIVGFWNLFYLVMSAGVIYLFGLKGAEWWFGLRLRVDVYERRNFAAALVIAAFMLATGLIFGGSMWGESTPESLEYGGLFMILPSYEDGWWIIPWFFLMGWSILCFTMVLWFYREKSVSPVGIRRDRVVADAKAAAVYCLACAIPLTDAVAGDYYGIADSFIGFAVIALPVLAHEVLRPSSPEHQRSPKEPWLYLAFGVASIIVAPIVSTMLGFRL